MTEKARGVATAGDTLRWRVEGMDCAGCVRKVESAVMRVDGVESVAANATIGSVSVTAKENRSPSRRAIESAIRGLGYGVTPDEAGGSPSKYLQPQAWWQSAKGRLVGASGALLVLAFALHWVWPELGNWPFVVATIVGLVPIAQAAWRALRVGEPFTIEMLMTIAAGGALVIDAAAESAVVVFLFAVGELLEGVAASRARRSISALSDLKPSMAQHLEDGEPREVLADTLLPGQWVLVRPGDRVPCDGLIGKGSSYLDESPVTGESVPRLKTTGDTVFAGTVNHDGALKVEVTRRAEDNTISRIIRLVEEAQAAKAPVARFIDRFARWYMPVVAGLAGLMAVVPPLALGMAWSESIYRALALLLIACPCALVISTPAAIAAGLSSGARRGLLIKGGAVLETLGKLKTIAMDKTGTLTVGMPQVTDVVAFTDDDDERGILRLAAALERESSHPIATAIMNYARKQDLALPRVQAARALSGAGVAGHVEDRDLQLASPRHVADRLTEQPERRDYIESLEKEGKSVAILVEGERLLGVIAVRDEPRDDAREGLWALERLGVKAVMLSGDNARTAAAIGQALGIEAYGELMPDDKAHRVREWQASGRGPVGKVGDGINDAPALAAADVGIAMGGGTEVALETADAALLGNRVAGIAELIDLSRATLRNVKTNVALALGFKAIFLVTTAMGITGLWIAVMADTGATVLVTLNAMRLLRYRFE
ncbi:cadmium-translocating P-type ATPase [Halomonas sp. TRM85114]|uniref:heavy metal translocating P-type ATPase n=1 Tax=Halomonas jincaotanensis TaxID=2810616 RepID=UPI001BD5FCDB|nr:heavy metal translocating P-type ATPase [Halomonas jincaotanensis]MBS9402531.1 cadmium-translocating P-type ATPase [Halomonas jincaotanensis]